MSTSSASDADSRLLAAAGLVRDASGASPAALRAILGASIRLYAAACEMAGEELNPIDRDITTTEAMMLASALVRSQNLNAFDFAMWFSRGR